MTQPEQFNAIDRRKVDAARLAKIRQRLDTDTTARQEAIANFVLSTAAIAKQLREALDIKATGIDAQAMPRFDDFIDELTYRIRFTFHRTFGRDLFDCPPADERTSEQYWPPPLPNVADEMKQIREAREAERNRDPVPPT
jgi:hypothetical protein